MDNVTQNSMFWAKSVSFCVRVDAFRVTQRHLEHGLGSFLARMTDYSLIRLSDPNRGHSGSRRSLDADVGVLEDEAIFRVDAQALGSQQEGVGSGFGVSVVAGADQGVEQVKEAEGFEGADDGLAGAAGDYGEGDVAVLEVDLFEDFGDGLKLVDEVVVEALFAVGELFDGDGEVVAEVEFGDDGVYGAATPGVEEVFGEGGAAVLVEGLGPGDEVDGHGVGDGAVAVEEVGLEVACGKGEGHGCSLPGGDGASFCGEVQEMTESSPCGR